MPNRIIKESINESRSLSEISFFAEDLYKRLITYADDYGRFNADYQIILARLYPREIQIVRELDIEDALTELSGAGKVAFYTSEARREIYGCFPNWGEHQRIRESKTKCPDPDDTKINDWYLRRHIPMRLKQQVIERDSFKCQLCNKYITTISDSKYLIKMGAGLYHIDHIVPVSQGGRATLENLRLTCPKCNLERKRYFTIDEILKMTLEEMKLFETCETSPQLSASFRLNPIQSEYESKRDISACARFEDFWKAYPRDGNRAIAEVNYCRIFLNDCNLSEDSLVKAAENYAEYVKVLNRTGDFITKPENFLKNNYFVDFLPGQYKKPDKPKSKNQFCNFEQNDVDMDALEKELLSY